MLEDLGGHPYSFLQILVSGDVIQNFAQVVKADKKLFDPEISPATTTTTVTWSVALGCYGNLPVSELRLGLLLLDTEGIVLGRFQLVQETAHHDHSIVFLDSWRRDVAKKLQGRQFESRLYVRDGIHWIPLMSQGLDECDYLQLICCLRCALQVQRKSQILMKTLGLRK